MSPKFVFRACCIAGGLMLCSVFAADRKPSLIGATRAEVLARFGEPKGNLVVGNREVLYFTGERITLRDDRVIDVEEVPVDAPPSKPAPASTASDTTSGSASANAGDNTGAAAPNASAGATAQGTGTASPSTPPAPAAPEVIIKSVRPPSHSTSSTDQPSEAPAATPAPIPAPAAASPAPAASTTTASVTATPPSTTPTTPGKATEPTSTSPAALTSTAPTSTASPAATATASETTASETTATVSTTAADITAGVAKPSGNTNSTGPAPLAKASPVTAPTRSQSPVEPPPEGMFSTRTYVIALVIIIGGIGYLIWRRRQRSLLLEATEVSNTPVVPVAAAVPAVAAARFTTDLLNKLEWKRFEELVAAYYNKTGVVASRTKSGPASPVHIRISWKGEQRPFACVACVPRPTSLVEAKPVQALSEALTSEDVRRGYVVTSGKFGVPARDVAEEKHITLLSGDLFIEKLNALPDPVRAELLRDATVGDYTTPTCPTCETKMTRSASDPSGWQCPQCGTTLARG